MKEKLIEVDLSGYTIFLTKSEIQTLLKSDPDIWKESLKRGKHIMRSRMQKQREAAKGGERK